MNLIDQKLKDKLRQFENIDNDINLIYTKKKVDNIKEKNLINKKCIDDTNKKIISKDYDNIYCNFSIDQKNTNTNIKYDKPLVKNKSKPSLNNSKINYKDNNAGTRLYNYGFYVKNKLEKKRKEEDIKIHNQMTPKINSKSKRINRNPNFVDRLYYQSSNSNVTTSHDNSILNKSNNKNNDDSFYKKRTLSKDSKFSYKPKLNKNSLKIAENLESSSNRLLRNNSKCKNKSPLSNNHTYNKSKSPCKKNNTSYIKKCNELYQKGVENMKNRDKIYKEKKLKENDEYKKYSFKPKILKNSPLIENDYNLIPKSNKSSDRSNSNELYKKQFEWKKKLDSKNKQKRDILEKENSKDCTFKPEISHLHLKNDENFILKNIAQMNKYVNKRRENIKKQKEFEEYKNKKFGFNNNFIIKPTIPKEFDLSTDSRKHSRSKSKSPSNRKLFYNFNISIQREDFGGDSFFNDNEQYFNQNFNLNSKKNSTCNYFNASNINFNENNKDKEQEKFINAVNEIHSRIENLNI